jgi:hypothetical protein
MIPSLSLNALNLRTDSVGIVLAGTLPRQPHESRNKGQRVSGGGRASVDPGVAVTIRVDGRAELEKIRDNLLIVDSQFTKNWKAQFSDSMQEKATLYTKRSVELKEIMEHEKRRINNFETAAREAVERPGGGQPATAWDITSDVRTNWASAADALVIFKEIRDQAHSRKTKINDGTSRQWAKELSNSIKELMCLFPDQDMLFDGLASLINSFVGGTAVDLTSLDRTKPQMLRQMLTFLITGNAGTGKTTLGKLIAKILGKLGVLVYEDAVFATRADFIAEFEGQTPARTKRFLDSHLEHVIFLDEAYALTAYNEMHKPRQLTTYSGEALAELLNFLSTEEGNVGFVAAGYAKQMFCDFLAANDGMPRRFVYKIHIDDYTPTRLCQTFYAHLSKLCQFEARHMERFNTREMVSIEARRFLYDCAKVARELVKDYVSPHPPQSSFTTTPDPLGACIQKFEVVPYEHEQIAGIFKDQAASMTYLAETLMRAVNASDSRMLFLTKEIQDSTTKFQISMTDMFSILSSHAQNSLGQAEGEDAMDELVEVLNQWFERSEDTLTMAFPSEYNRDDQWDDDGTDLVDCGPPPEASRDGSRPPPKKSKKPNAGGAGGAGGAGPSNNRGTQPRRAAMNNPNAQPPRAQVPAPPQRMSNREGKQTVRHYVKDKHRNDRMTLEEVEQRDEDDAEARALDDLARVQRGGVANESTAEWMAGRANQILEERAREREAAERGEFRDARGRAREQTERLRY